MNTAFYKTPSVLDAMYTKLNYVDLMDENYDEINSNDDLKFLKKIRNSYKPPFPDDIMNGDENMLDEVKEVKQNNPNVNDKKINNNSSSSSSSSGGIMRSSFYISYSPNDSKFSFDNFQHSTFPQQLLPMADMFGAFSNMVDTKFSSFTPMTMNYPFNLDNVFPSNYMQFEDLENVKKPLTRQAFNSIPDVKYTNIKNFGDTKDDKCSICLTEFEDDDTVKYTECCHFYHPTCLEEWTKQNYTCPICRKSLGNHTTDM